MSVKRQDIANIYNRLASRYAGLYFDDLSDKPILDRFRACLPKRAKILDAGCGPGNFVRYFLKKGYYPEGIDLSREMLDIAEEKVPQGKFTLMDFEKPEYPPDSFDGVIASYSFIYVLKKSARTVLLRLKKIIKPGGAICLILLEGRGETLSKSLFNTQENAYTALWTMPRITALLEDVNFEILFKFQTRKKEGYRIRELFQNIVSGTYLLSKNLRKAKNEKRDVIYIIAKNIK